MIERRNLEILVGSHFPILVIETHEEQRALDLLRGILLERGTAFYTWTVAQGLKGQLGGKGSLQVENLQLRDAPASDDTLDPAQMLAHVNRTLKNSLVVLLDFHPYLDNPAIVRATKEIALDFYLKGNRLVLLSHAVELPDEIRRYCARFELALPDRKRIREMIDQEASLWRARNGNGRVRADAQAVELLAQNLVGLTVTDATRLIRNAIYNDGAITRSDLPGVMEAKYELVGQSGALSFEYDTASFGEVGGFGRLKAWLEKRRLPFLDIQGSVMDVPKGILLAGVQGSGKSLAAKAIAGAWQVPLLRLDLGALYNKYIGESERNVREVLKAADVIAPCVLWIDEIEKGVSTGDSDNGTSQRILGTLLTWMAERKSRVFVVATANRIEALPPELVRKGRLDEIFFVDLPTPAARGEILRAHLAKRGIDGTGLDLDAAVAQSEGFSGAELEQAVVAARYAAQADSTRVGTAHLLEEIRQTRPLSTVMAEQIAALRAWASSRTVPVD
ncbi:AAA family ATPase [Stutzerimonas azotifigens]|uniref:AAA family ATPase n=1 Tax=Stutzerimonas azotifigens TaxID=291995 RepID=UPI00040D6076|nr:AAA family ATPase [Stutzerimonas azotifigens]